MAQKNVGRRTGTGRFTSRTGTGRFTSAAAGKSLKLNSRQGLVVKNLNDSDFQFLKLADEFLVDAERIQAGRSRREPRNRLA